MKLLYKILRTDSGTIPFNLNMIPELRDNFDESALIWLDQVSPSSTSTPRKRSQLDLSIGVPKSLTSISTFARLEKNHVFCFLYVKFQPIPMNPGLQLF